MSWDEILGISDLPVAPEQIALLIAIGVGGLYCFVGYRFFKVVLACSGLLLSGGVALFLGAWITEGDFVVALLCGLFGGAAGAYSMFFLYRGGVFCLGLLGALVVANNVLSAGTA